MKKDSSHQEYDKMPSLCSNTAGSDDISASRMKNLSSLHNKVNTNGGIDDGGSDEASSDEILASRTKKLSTVNNEVNRNVGSYDSGGDVAGSDEISASKNLSFVQSFVQSFIQTASLSVSDEDVISMSESLSGLGSIQTQQQDCMARVHFVLHVLFICLWSIWKITLTHPQTLPWVKSLKLRIWQLFMTAIWNAVDLAGVWTH